LLEDACVGVGVVVTDFGVVVAALRIESKSFMLLPLLLESTAAAVTVPMVRSSVTVSGTGNPTWQAVV
jgi:hypothetical protein